MTTLIYIVKSVINSEVLTVIAWTILILNGIEFYAKYYFGIDIFNSEPVTGRKATNGHSKHSTGSYVIRIQCGDVSSDMEKLHKGASGAETDDERNDSSTYKAD